MADKIIQAIKTADGLGYIDYQYIVNKPELKTNLNTVADNTIPSTKAVKDYVDEHTLIVTGEYDGMRFIGTMSATYAQMLAAYNANKNVELRLTTDSMPSQYVLRMVGCNEDGDIIFGGIDGAEYEDGHLAVKVKVTSADSWGFEYLNGSSGGGIPDAPSDGKQYARKDGAWSVVEASTPPEVENAIATGGIGWTSEAMIIEWDGDTTGLDEFPEPDLPYSLYKVSDVAIPKSDIVGGTITMNSTIWGPEPEEYSIPAVVDATQPLIGYIVVLQENILAIAVTEPCVYNGETLSIGTYFAKSTNEIFVSKLQSAGEEIIHKIDGKYLPSIPTQLSQLTGDTTHRTVTDAEKTAWNGKQDALIAGASITIAADGKTISASGTYRIYLTESGGTYTAEDTDGNEIHFADIYNAHESGMTVECVVAEDGNISILVLNIINYDSVSDGGFALFSTEYIGVYGLNAFSVALELANGVETWKVPNGDVIGMTSSVSASSTDAEIPTAKAVHTALGDYALKDELGELSDLDTTDKSNIVAAINEVAASGGGISDAPIDGKPYARKDGAWIEVEASTPTEVTNAIETGGIGWTDGGTITWDGDTTGRDSFEIYENKYLYKVSDAIISMTDFKQMSGFDDGGNPMVITAQVWADYIVEFDDAFFALYVFSGTAGNYDATLSDEEHFSFTVPSAGTYFFKDPVEPVMITAAEYGTVHKIDEKYLTAVGSKFTVTVSNNDGVVSADKTLDEIKVAFDAGRLVVAHYGSEQIDFTCVRANENGAIFTVGMAEFSGGLVSALFCFADNEWSFYSTSIPTTLAELTDDSTHRTVTDAEKSEWNNKQSKTIIDAAGYYTSDTIEGALAEIGAQLFEIDNLIGNGVIE